MSCSQLLRLVVVYRPPSSPFNIFLAEFSALLETLVVSSGKFLICGVFNLHVDCQNDRNAALFLDLVDSFTMKCFDTHTPTHKSGHTLDLLITRNDSTLLSSLNIEDPLLSDHFAVHCSLAVLKPPPLLRTLMYRKIRSIDLDVFRCDLANSSLCSSPSSDVSSLCSQ